MPDRFRFNDLSDRVECVDCDAAGPRHEWPAERREQHHREAHAETLDAEARSEADAKRAEESAARASRRRRAKASLYAERECRGCARRFVPTDPRQVYHDPICREAGRYQARCEG